MVLYVVAGFGWGSGWVAMVRFLLRVDGNVPGEVELLLFCREAEALKEAKRGGWFFKGAAYDDCKRKW